MTALYRHFNDAGVLLYVGVSLDVVRRLGQHESAPGWYEQISTVTIERHESRKAALLAEQDAINSENPAYNIRGRRAGRVHVGERCHLCGRREPMTDAERQRRYRERKKRE